MFRKMLKNKRGFSLVELIIVIAIMGVLAGIAGPQVFKYLQDSQVKADVQTALQIQNSIKMAISMGEVSYNNATGDLVTGTANANMTAVLTAVTSRLTGIANPKENGHLFYVYLSQKTDYMVLSYKSGETTATLQQRYPKITSLPVTLAVPTSGATGDGATWKFDFTAATGSQLVAT